ncbi:MAG: addiction module antidote protein, HigA family [Candidatus Scalindua sp. AMX11]|nr:MAG: addiction module antidote protein, HigA family [Candidatus Scalindua sp.]NOG85400.1 HigA family addiction module antidote protein [Planctomycetota bacterium]RZV83996.1 MAG: addiction module antidote protein, HigA family [Candidatus Scalindua sp. SCAELEC01]TDE65719.1 MAG: addiction module antidote protein, HigA family [Candidatus Scalindua sp. AMX11]GJQ58788.1 MAG: transcriptional regulator [Candidatus Scalindua sp.]
MSKKFIEIEHPGVMLKEDFLDDLGIKPGTFAKAIGVDRTAIKNIIDGKRAITADMALRFSLYFNMSAGFWLNLQKDYELRTAKRERLTELKKAIQPFEAAHA